MDNNRDTVSWSVSVLDTEHYTVPPWVASEDIEQHTHRESVSAVQGKDTMFYIGHWSVGGAEKAYRIVLL